MRPLLVLLVFAGSAQAQVPEWFLPNLDYAHVNCSPSRHVLFARYRRYLQYGVSPPSAMFLVTPQERTHIQNAFNRDPMSRYRALAQAQMLWQPLPTVRQVQEWQMRMLPKVEQRSEWQPK